MSKSTNILKLESDIYLLRKSDFNTHSHKKDSAFTIITTDKDYIFTYGELNSNLIGFLTQTISD